MTHRLLAGFVLCVGVVILSVSVAAVPGGHLTIGDATVEPETPTAGTPTTVTATVESSVGSEEPVSIEQARLLDENDTTLTNATNLGTLSPGDTLAVPLTTTFDEPGERSLELEMLARNATGTETTVNRPVTVVVEPAAPTLETNVGSVVANTTTTVTTTVSNPTETPLRDVVVRKGGEHVETSTDERVVSSLAPGEERDLEFDLRAVGGANETLLRTDVTYRTPAGTTDHVNQTRVFDIEPRTDDVAIRVTTEDTAVDEEVAEVDAPEIGIDIPGFGGGDDGEEITPRSETFVTVSNVGNAPVSNVVVESVTDQKHLATQPVTTELAPGEERSVPVSLSAVSETVDVTFEARYEVPAAAGPNDTERVSTVLERGPTGGTVIFTGIDIDIEDETATVTGDVGNPGESTVSGVVVTGKEGEEVAPVYPNRDFFVGEVESDGFAPFEVTAAVGENATHIPLEVQYFVDDERQNESVSLPLDGVERTQQESGVPWLLSVVVGFLALAGVLVTVTLYRRRGD